MTSRAVPERVEEYLARCRASIYRTGASLLAPAAGGATPLTVTEIRGFLSQAGRRTARTNRRLPRGGTVPQHGKVLSISGSHTRWISKCTVGCAVEPGVPVRVLEDRQGLILHHEVMWEAGDVDHAVPMAGAARRAFPNLRALGFDRGFHSPGNRIHPAVESATDSLRHRGSDRALVFGAEGFGRTVALAVVATDGHRIVLPLRRKERPRRTT